MYIRGLTVVICLYYINHHFSLHQIRNDIFPNCSCKLISVKQINFNVDTGTIISFFFCHVILGLTCCDDGCINKFSEDDRNLLLREFAEASPEMQRMKIHSAVQHSIGESEEMKLVLDSKTVCCAAYRMILNIGKRR